MKKLILLALFLFPSVTWCADKIQGNACYTYGDSESLIQAEQMAKTFAIRNAIESYSIFIESTTKITDLQLSSDLVKLVSTGQVKGPKVLRRLESGRKLCYTVEALIDPQETKKAINDFLKNKSVDVRVQDNGWLRIVDYFVEEKRMGDLDKDFEKIPGLKDVITKKLDVKIQFLKQCKAKLLSDKIKEASSKAEIDKYTGILIYIWGYAELSKSGKKKEMEEFRVKVLESMPDLDKIMEEYYFFPKFKCDYRTKVFVTFYNSLGVEVKTAEQVPIAYWKDEERKIEILPGETTYVTFIIPDGATSWDIWLPK